MVDVRTHFYIQLPSSKENKAVEVCYGREIRVRDTEREGEKTEREQRGRHSAALQLQSQQMLGVCEAGALFC